MWKKLNRSGRDERLLELLLRIGVGGCFIGHGAFGVIGKEGWLPYFAIAGIGEEWAWRLMPIVGSVDIVIGILALIAPRPAYLGYAALWAAWTALLRPLSGESVFETLERAGNYGVPVAFLLLAGVKTRSWRAWLQTIEVPVMTPHRRNQVMLALRATTCTLLAGHGGLALLGKPLLVAHAGAVGLPEGASALMGAFEVALAGAIVIRPAASLLIFALVWKVGTEALYPVTGAPFWEFVERAGSYIAPLALWSMVRAPVRWRLTLRARAATRLSLLVLLVGMLAMEPAARPDSSQEATLLARLRPGGFVLACRHAITDHGFRGEGRVDLKDRSTQRLLTPEGEAQARRLGEILLRQRIPIGEVLTSPYFRTADSAELTFGRAEVHDALHGSSSDKTRALKHLLSSAPQDGTNRALMTHQGVLYRVFEGVERGSIREGDCLVVEPGGEGFEVLARLGPDEWEALR
jgi:phosphohistidine phosphatase SixA